MPPLTPTPGLRQTLLGVCFTSTATSIGGGTVVLTRLIMAQTEPLSLTFLRYGIAASILLAVLLTMVRVPRVPARDLAALALLGVIMFASFPYCMARALEDTTAARGGLLFATTPLLTMVIGTLFRVERLTLAKAAAVALAGTGTALALGEQVGAAAPHALRGDLYMFLGILSGSVFNVFAKRYLMHYGSLPVMVYTMLVGVAALLLLALAFEHPFSGSLDFDAEGWTLLLLLAIPGGAVMLYSWGRGLQLISPTQAAVTVGLNPVTAILLGAWLLGEPITARIVAGFALILGAIMVASYRKRGGAPVGIPS